MTEFLAASNSVAQRPPPIATRTSRKVHPELSSANLKVHARAPGAGAPAAGAPLKAERLGSDASIASTQRLGSDASIASTPTLFETSPSSSFRNADDEDMSVCPSEDPSEGTPTQPTQPTQPQPSQSARAWDRLYFARALRVSPPAGRRSPSSAEH